MTTTDELPPLPETVYGLFYEAPGDGEDEGWQEFVDEPGYTSEKMRAYATAARAPLLAELDRLRAKVSDMRAEAERDRMQLAALRERAESAELDAQRYRAFFERGPMVCFMGQEYTDKAECDAAIDAAIKGSAA